MDKLLNIMALELIIIVILYVVVKAILAMEHNKKIKNEFCNFQDFVGYNLSKDYGKLYDMVMSNGNLTHLVLYCSGIGEFMSAEYPVGYCTINGGFPDICHDNRISVMESTAVDKAAFIAECKRMDVVWIVPDTLKIMVRNQL
jgi:hypothetical protein